MVAEHSGQRDGERAGHVNDAGLGGTVDKKLAATDHTGSRPKIDDLTASIDQGAPIELQR